MPKYEVRVVREVLDEEVLLEIEAPNEDIAKALAITEAMRDADLYFGPIEDPAYFADDPELMEEDDGEPRESVIDPATFKRLMTEVGDFFESGGHNGTYPDIPADNDQ